MSRRTAVAFVAILVATLAVAGVVHAQRYFREGSFAARWAPAQMPDSSFVICRVAYRSVRMEYSGIGWQTDYPYAEINLTTRLSELTKTRVSRDDSHQPNFYVVRLTDDQLFNCPITVMSDAGTIGIRDEEAERLRTYLLKGGFLWADDFWGEYAWSWFVGQLRKALPASEFPISDLPLDHPIFHTQFEVKKVAQIPSINFFFGSGRTSERGADSAVAHARGVTDKKGRMIVLITHNTDFGDSWEREGDDATYFVNFGPDGYAFGIDAVIYALTH